MSPFLNSVNIVCLSEKTDIKLRKCTINMQKTQYIRYTCIYQERHTIFTEFKKGDIQYSLSLKRETYNIH
jgi:hypothetical protein